MILKKTHLLIVLSLMTTLTYAQSNETSKRNAMFDELAKMDSLLFDNQFKKCDCDKAKGLFAEDLEFYHDLQGLQFTSLEIFLEDMKERCKNWYIGELPKLKRKLVKGSLEVYPLKNYGAIQMGIHQFYQLQEDKTYKLASIAKFTHVWKKEENGQWKISRVLSYDHQPAE